MKKIMLLTLLLWLSFSALQGQTPVSIAQARLVPVGDTVTIRGIILNGSEIGIIRYIQDPTGGLALYDGSMTYMLRGDSVQVTGVMTSYNQLLELISVTNDTVFSSGNPLPLPMVITPSQFGEIHESVMIRMNDVTFSNPGGTFSGNTNYNITSGGQQAQIRIANGSPLVGQLIPTSMMDIVGIGSQFSYSNPAAGYQMLLRDQQDIISNLSISLTSPVVVSNITTTSFDLAWTTNIQGTTEAFYGLTPSLGSHATTPTGSTNHSLSITGASPAAILYVKAFSVANGDTAFAGLNVYATQSLSSGAMKVYFTSTVDNTFSTGVNAIQLDDLMDDTLIAYINRAHQTIDLAVYNFNTQNISNIAAALNNASNRGVQVRVVYDGTTANLGIQSLYASIGKISSPTTSEYGIMHNKFIVIDAFHSNPDSAIVWMGSMNWTETCINQFANNVVIIQDQSLAKAYTLEFEEMFGSTGVLPNPANAKFGPYKTNNTPHEFVIGGKRVKSFFSPSDGVNAQIINHIEAAQHQVYVNTMLITRSDISYALRDKSIAGTDVKVIINNDGDCTQLVVDVLTNQLGANFKEFGESYTLHNKLMIIDPGYPGANPFVWTGSHNWSNAADQRNDENTLVIYDSTIANIYLQEFQQRWSLGVPLSIPERQNHTSQLNLFPNPTNGSFTLTTNGLMVGNASVEIFRLDGQLVHVQQEILDGGNQEITISQSFPSGFYLVRLITSGGISTGKLIVK